MLAIIKTEGIKIKVPKMKMLRWICSVTRLDKINNKYRSGNLGVTNVAGQIREN